MIRIFAFFGSQYDDNERAIWPGCLSQTPAQASASSVVVWWQTSLPGLIVDSASGTARVCNFVISPASTLMFLYFDGGSRRGCTAGDYVQIDDSPDFSIPTTGELTIEAWIQPTAPNLEFLCPEPDGPSSPIGYLHWMGKGDDSGSSGNREWAMRMYDTRNTVGRTNRTAIYVFNPEGGEGTGSRQAYNDGPPPCPNVCCDGVASVRR